MTRALTRYFIVLTCIFAALLVAPKAHAASLSELQKQLTQLQQDLSHYQDLQSQAHDQAQNYSSDIATKQQQINQVTGTIQSLQSQISDKEKSIDSTGQDIDQKIQDLNERSQTLNTSIANFYELNNFSDVVMLADNQSISHSEDQLAYGTALQNKILKDIDNTTAAKQNLEAAKTKLEQQHTELAILKGEQEAKNNQLVQQKNQTKVLLTQTQSKEQQYQGLVKKLNSEKDQVSGEIYTLRAALSKKNNEVYIGGTSGYPFAAINAVDPWSFLTRQCTSYVAWKWNVMYGRQFTNTRPGEGSAYNWPALARDQGYNVTSRPQVGAIVSWDRSSVMPYGHVAIVEGVNGDGTINVSEYNWVKYSYSFRDHVQYQQYGNARFIVP